MPFESDPNDKFDRMIYFSLRAWWQDIIDSSQFLTRFNIIRTESAHAQNDFHNGDPDNLAQVKPIKRAVRAFPLIGALLGLCGGLAFAVSSALGIPDLVSGIIAISIIALATGALHEDGLADMIDGFGGGRTVETKLSIMRDSRIGAYGVIALITVLAAKVGVLADLGDIGVVICTLICSAATSRAAMPAMMRWLPPARRSGLSAQIGQPTAKDVYIGIAIAGILCVCLLGWSGILAFLMTASAAILMVLLTKKQIGGHTGDVLGGTQQICELAFLLTLVAII